MSVPHRVQRLDEALVARGLAESRTQAQRLIRAGSVRVDGQLVVRPSHSVRERSCIELLARPRFVSRGGEKLEAAFQAFGLCAEGKICLDVGASTGGFTDCLLQHGARRVYAVDVGRGTLHWKLRTDPRVVSLEGINARYLSSRDVPEPVGLAVVDVSFISLRLVLPAIVPLVEVRGDIVTLIKPQFEAGRNEVGRGGVIRSQEVRQRVVDSVRQFGVESLGLVWVGVIPSPVKGPAGNVEFLAAWKRP